MLCMVELMDFRLDRYAVQGSLQLRASALKRVLWGSTSLTRLSWYL